MNQLRAGLLALLPVIAGAVYLDGQRYDPAAMKYKPGGGAGAAVDLPSQVVGLSMDGRPGIYHKDNLFEHVNGHAEFFISLGFKTLSVVGYSPQEASPGKPEYTVEVYDMGKAENAFGALAQESAGMDPIQVGALGYSSSRSVMFITGDIYVKIDSFGTGEKLSELASAIAGAMPVTDTGLPQFAIFPTKGALAQGRHYKREDYMGMEIFREVFEQEYERQTGRFYAFTFTPGYSERRYLEKVETSVDEMGAQTQKTRFGGVDGLVVEDKYEGTWGLAVKDGQVLGARGFSDKEELTSFMEELVNQDKGL